ncbi:MAG TPA: hypothetical protein VG895_02125 [Patescibacteria group bacterium]|nr:hypothetical protein [Patescibacteria group bacterium]
MNQKQVKQTKIKTEQRYEMIDLLIMDCIEEWVFARCYYDLKELMCMGFKGYDNYTDKELEEEIEDKFDPERIQELREALKAEDKRDEEIQESIDEFWMQDSKK